MGASRRIDPNPTIVRIRPMTISDVPSPLAMAPLPTSATCVQDRFDAWLHAARGSRSREESFRSGNVSATRSATKTSEWDDGPNLSGGVPLAVRGERPSYRGWTAPDSGDEDRLIEEAKMGAASGAAPCPRVST